MRAPRLLDLFCGAGGATRGYQLAGFHVTGVDIDPQPHYIGDDFHQADALTFPFDGYDAIHASPPCQAYVQWNNLNAERYGTRVDHPMLIEPVRARLAAAGVPYVLENVVGAPLCSPLMLCGSMFGLGVRRHRLFESNTLVMRKGPCRHTRAELAVYGRLDGRRIWTRSDGSEVRAARTLEEAQEAMGMPWGDWHGVKEAIPPAYTAWVGWQLLAAVQEAAA